MTVAPVLKACSKCGAEKPRTEFSRSGSREDGLQHKCKACDAAYYAANREVRKAAVKTRRDADPEAAREAWRVSGKKHYRKNRVAIIAKRYGLSAEQYHEMVARQNGKCAICAKPPGANGLQVDHCHDSGAVRGLLCMNCNTALGKFGDDSRSLRSAAEYVEKHQTDRLLPFTGSPDMVLDEQGYAGNFDSKGR